MFVSFGVRLLRLVAIVGGIVECGQRFDHVEVIFGFQ